MRCQTAEELKLGMKLGAFRPGRMSRMLAIFPCNLAIFSCAFFQLAEPIDFTRNFLATVSEGEWYLPLYRGVV